MKLCRSFLFFITFSCAVFAQHSYQPQNNSTNFLGTFSNNITDSDSVVSIIVEFKEEPLFLAQQNSVAQISTLQYENRFAEFENDLSGLLSQSTSGRTQLISSNQKKFYKAFFGITAQISQGMIPLIEQLPYVKKIHYNKRVEAFVENNAGLIKSDQVLTIPGLTGEGIIIGIIDSGIDYLHPALGGGLGSSFKVIGGYDFVNSDNDPMDDFGHGTHVAGIAAGNDLNFKGAAPDAKLYAFKVLNSEGNGSMENVLAAIERTVDPNNDGDMSDKLDIVNISLGSSNGDPDDPTSTAVDNATMLGVTFCIAAGNSGNAEPVEGKENNYYYNGSETIGSPGTSRLAITVGAIDSLNKLAYFSSKGPVRGDFGIKPEVVAPGVDILSSYPGNEYVSKSGTSMAAPMIAGIAALLKSKNKNLTPLQIKSAMVNSSVDLGLKIMQQGAGKVDVLRAILNSSFAEPVNLNFGLDNPAQTTWTKVETVKIFNTGSIMQNYSVSFNGTAAGITLSASPQNFSLQPGAVQDVEISVSANNAVIPIVDEDIILYSGFAHISGTIDTLHLPWSFARTTRMLLSFSEPGVQFVGSSFNYYVTPSYNKFFSKVRWLDSKNLEVAGAFNGSYDFAVYFPNNSSIVVKDQLLFTGAGEFSFNASDAVHKVHFDGVDNNNIPFSSMGQTKRSLRVNLPNGFVFAKLPDGINTINVSPASGEFSFQGIEAFIGLHDTKKIFLPQYASFTGMSGDVHLTNPSTAYYSQTMKFKFPENTFRTRLFSDIVSYQIVSGQEYYVTSLVGADTLDIQNEEISFDLFLMKPVGEYNSAISFHTNTTYETDSYVDVSTQYFSIVNDSIKHGFPSLNWLTTYKSPNGGTMIFGDLPVFIMNLSYNNSFGPSIHFSPIFRGGLSETRYNDYNYGKYTIYNSSGVKLKEDALNVSPRYPFEVIPDKYRLEIEAQSYKLRNAKGTIKLITNVDLTQSVPDEPRITSFILLDSEKKAANNFVKNENAELVFSSKVYAAPEQLPVDDSTKVFYRKFKTEQWFPLDVIKKAADIEREGAIYSAMLNAATAFDSAGIDLKIRVVDATGNSAEHILSPAFSVGNWVDDGTTPVEEDDEIAPAQFTLYQNYPNPFNPETTIKFTIPANGETVLKVYNILGEEVATLFKGVAEAGKYHEVRFDASSFSSGIYIARLQSGNNQMIKKMMLLK